MHQSSPDGQQGFTLIELLMAIAISGVIISALAAGFIATMKGTAGAHERFVASNGAHTLATYFTSDVQSANPSLVTTAAADTGCSDPAAGTDNVLRLQWSEMSTATKMTAFSVSYRTRKVGSEWQLARYACSGWANLPTTPSAILSSAAPTASVMASDIWDATDPAYKTLASVIGRRVTMTTYSALAAGQSEPYSYTVSADMRTPALVPTVVGINALDPNPTNAPTVSWTVKFSDNVTGVDAGDFDVVDTGLTGAGLVSPTPVVQVDAKTYTVTANTGSGSAGTIGLNLIDDDSIEDADGDPLGDIGANNGNFTGEVYTLDRIAPTVTVAQHAAQADPTMSLPIRFTVTFSEPIQAFDGSHVTRGGTAPGAAAINVAGVSPTVYDVEVSGITGDGTVTVAVAAGKVKDLAGNNNAASTGTDEVAYQTPPLVTSVNRSGPSPTSAATLGWTVTFNKAVTGVDAGDFALVPSPGVSGAGGITVTPASATTYTVTANRGTGAGTVGLDVIDHDDSIEAAGVPLGGPGANNGNFSGQIYDVLSAPTITSVELLNRSGGTAGKLEAGDSIVVTFGSTMKVSSFCSTWSNDASNQNITTGNAVTVTVTNSGSTDSLAVTSSTCPTSSFGSIDLQGDYVSRDVTFSGNGNNASNPATTVTWDATTRKLTITFGKETSAGGPGNPTNTVSSPTAPVYSTGATDPAGIPVGNMPFTLPSAVQF